MAKKNKVVIKRKKTKVLKSAKSGKILLKKKLTKKVIGKKKVNKKKIIAKAKKIIKKIVRPVPAKAKKQKIKKVKAVVKIRKAVKHKIKVSSVKSEITKFPAESLFKAKIKVVGIGGGGGSIVSEIGRSLEKATFVIADTDIRALKKKSGIKYFWFGEKLTHGLGTGVNVELAKQAAIESKEKISSFFKDQDIIIFVASLGGGLGSGATQVFAEAAREFGGITLGIFTMPFKFEGKNKYRIAQNALKSLRKSLNVSLVIPNEKIFKVIDSSTPITNAFSIVNKSLIESLESLIDLIYNPGIINIDFADLRTVLKGVGNSAFLNTIEESGKDRVEKICENIFKNPLLQSNSFKAEKILFNIAGGENLSMFEVEKISSHISNLNLKAKIIFGISKNSKLNNKIKTTILMTGGQVEEEKVEDIVAEKIEPIKILEKVAKKKDNIIKKAKGNIKKIIKKKIEDKKVEINNTVQKKVSFIPVLEVPATPVSILGDEVDIIPTITSGKKTIRRSGLEIKKAEEQEEKKRIAQEKEWEIPAFLRKIKYKN